MKYWFRQKTYGFGATPNTWQGWLLTVLACVLSFAVVLLGPYIRDNGLRALWMTLGLGAVLIPFIALAWIKTEGGWRLGKHD